MSGELKLKQYSLTELHEVPATPGIYAWYGRLILGPPDWKSDIDAESRTDYGEQRFRLALRKHSERYRPLPMQAESYVAFRDHWRGTMEASTYDAAANAITNDDKIYQELGFPLREFKQIMSSGTLRGSLASVLEEISPVFATPLYIGKSQNLRKRLERHAADLRKIFNLTKDEPEKLKTLQEKVRFNSEKSEKKDNEKTASIGFAARAIAAGFSPDMLHVYTLETLDYTGDNIEKANDLACTIEWLANTWHRPLLGKK